MTKDTSFGPIFCCLGNDCCIIGKYDNEYCSHDGNREVMKQIADKVISNNNSYPPEDKPNLNPDNNPNSKNDNSKNDNSKNDNSKNDNSENDNSKKSSNSKEKDEEKDEGSKEKDNKNNKTDNTDDNTAVSSTNEKNNIIINENSNSTNTTELQKIDNEINSAPLEDSSPRDKNDNYFTGVAAIFVVIVIILIIILIVFFIMKLRKKRKRNAIRLRDSYVKNSTKHSSLSSLYSDFMDPTEACKDYLNTLSHLQYKDPTEENLYSNNPYKKYSYFKYSPVIVPSITHSKTVSSNNTSSSPYTNNLHPIMIDYDQTNKSYSPNFSYNNSYIESSKYSCYRSHRESGKYSYTTSNNNTNLSPNYNDRKSHYSLSNMDISNFKFPIEEEQSPLTENTSFLTSSSYQGEEDVSMHLSIVNPFYRRASTTVSAPVKHC